MKQISSSRRLIPDTGKVVRKFIVMLEYLFVSASEKQADNWTRTCPWPEPDAKEIRAGLQKLKPGIDSDPCVELKILLEDGWDKKEPIGWLLKTIHPLVLVFRRYCQRHQSSFDNWLEGLVAVREFDELQIFLQAMLQRIGDSGKIIGNRATSAPHAWLRGDASSW